MRRIDGYERKSDGEVKIAKVGSNESESRQSYELFLQLFLALENTHVVLQAVWEPQKLKRCKNWWE